MSSFLTTYVSKFIIVVEIDYKRAQSVFSKAYDDVMLLWPMVLKEASDKDKVSQEKRLQALAEEEAREKPYVDYRGAMSEYYEKKRLFNIALEKWENTPWYDRLGRQPAKPSCPEKPPGYDYWSPHIGSYTDQVWPAGSWCVSAANSFLASLKKQRDLASAACANYRLVESEALEMIGWENGERMEYFKQRFLTEHTSGNTNQQPTGTEAA